MRWRGRRGSSHVEDRRGVAPRRVALGGGGVGILIVVIIAVVFGVNPTTFLQQMETGGSGVGVESPYPGRNTGGAGCINDEAKQFVSVVLADTEEVWRNLFREMDRAYRDPTLVLFTDQVQSACGFASAAVGPFYCSRDGKVYLDLRFFDELQRRLGAPGDFAQAYVIAHEVGHHVQSLLGISDQVHARKGRVSEAEYNQLSVRLELQADFLAGVWARHAQVAWGILEDGDIEEALGAASAVGDDTLQRQSQGRVVPDSFTHGTSEQRMRWFKRGFTTGDLSQGDTFSASEL